MHVQVREEYLLTSLVAQFCGKVASNCGCAHPPFSTHHADHPGLSSRSFGNALGRLFPPYQGIPHGPYELLAVACALDKVVPGALLDRLQSERFVVAGAQNYDRDARSLISGLCECFQSITVGET